MLELCKYAIAEEVEEEWVNRDRVRKLKTMACVEAYKQRKAQKAKIKEELLPVAWHPDRVIDWCFSEDEKVSTLKSCGSKYQSITRFTPLRKNGLLTHDEKGVCCGSSWTLT